MNSNAYKLAASPILFSEGQFTGLLQAVEFEATSPGHTSHWLTVNCGQFPSSFRKLIPRTAAHEIVAALNNGEAVEFPGLYQEELFDHRFTYIHNGAPVASCRSTPLFAFASGRNGSCNSCRPDCPAKTV